MTEEKPARLSLTDFVVLALVDEEPRHGFSAARELAAEASLGQAWTVARPLVYRAFDHLSAVGMIEPIGTEPGDQGPNRRVFRATTAGRIRVEGWLAEPVARPRDVRTELLAKLLLLHRRNLPLDALARRQLDVFGDQLADQEERCRRSTGAETIVSIWRLETLRGITRMLESIETMRPGLPCIC